MIPSVTRLVTMTAPQWLTDQRNIPSVVSMSGAEYSAGQTKSQSIAACISRAALPAPGKVCAEHELHLVKHHEGQEEVVIQRAEDCQHHGRPHGQAFLGTAEDDCDAVLALESQ